MSKLMQCGIKGLDFEEFSLYGCPECGCDTTIQMSIERGVTKNICQECLCQFLALSSFVSKTKALFPSGDKDEDGFLEFEPVIKEPHPRHGIPAHNPIDLDVEKTTNHEESCQFLDFITKDEYWAMRFVVKGKKSAERIRRIFDVLSDDENIKAFIQCEIDEASFQCKYAEISLLFDSSDYSRMEYLKCLIMADDTISKHIVYEALTKSMNKELVNQPE